MAKRQGVDEILEVVTVKLPTAFGEFQLLAFSLTGYSEPTLALIKGTVQNAENLLVRIHSSCLTGDVFGSERCDCGPQLHFAMKSIAEVGSGIIIYLHQEGRGIGLLQKIKAYKLQENGMDTVEANLALGLPADSREYSAAAVVLKHLSVRSVNLLTNNPEKQRSLEESGVVVAGLTPVRIEANQNNAGYLATKRNKMGHLLDILVQ